MNVSVNQYNSTVGQVSLYTKQKQFTNISSIKLTIKTFISVWPCFISPTETSEPDKIKSCCLIISNLTY